MQLPIFEKYIDELIDSALPELRKIWEQSNITTSTTETVTK